MINITNWNNNYGISYVVKIASKSSCILQKRVAIKHERYPSTVQ